MTLERGTLLHKRYRIVEILGQGGMGSVYRAVDENLGVDVAVKENLFTTDEYARQFRLEAVILANLRHPNLPRVYDHFVVGEQGQYLVMDFIEGEDLRQRMERIGTITEDEAVVIGAAMCDALEYLHTRKPSILHRDIKPGNVKITPEGHIYLVDFGLAKIVQGGQITTTGARAMTPGYSPPEQYGTARTDPRTDVYSLGATLYAALTGIIPEDGLARAMDNADLTPLRRRNSRISRRLSAVIEKAMAVDPADRYQTADEFKKALLGSKAITEQLTGRYTVAPPPVEARPTGRNRAKAQSNSEPRKPVAPLVPAVVEEEKPFIPPGKRLIEKQKRRQRQRRRWMFFWLIAAAALLGVLYLNPSMIPAEARSLLSFLSMTPTSTRAPAASATMTREPAATPTASRLPPTAVPTRTALPRPTATELLLPAQTTQTGPTPSATATPLGGGYGELAFASDRSGVSQIYLTDLLGKLIRPVTNMQEGA
ncbi:MAG: protein kinase domain-containing protein, partial [Bacteroidota bacterium]